jgi:hypothetical protein
MRQVRGIGDSIRWCAALIAVIGWGSAARAEPISLQQVDWPAVVAADPRLSVSPDCLALPPDAAQAVCISVPATAAVPARSSPGGETILGYAQTDAVLYGDLEGDGHGDAIIPIGVPAPAGIVGFLIYEQGEAGPALMQAVSGDKLTLKMTDSALLVSRPWYTEHDPNCCPSSIVRTSFALSHDQLVVVGESQQPIAGQSDPAAGSLSSCSNATVSGAYGFEASGLRPGSIPQPVALLGRVNLDGAGGGTGSVQIYPGAGLTSIPVNVLNYSVNPDCTGSVSVAAGFQAGFVILDGGKEIDFTDVDGLAFPSGLGKPLASGCSNATLDGSYVLSTHGWLIGPAGDPAAEAVGATQIFDGAGQATQAPVSATVAGQFSPRGMQAGAYGLDAKCTGTIQLSASDGTEEGGTIVAVAGGNEAFVLGTTPDEVLLGTTTCTRGVTCVAAGASTARAAGPSP